MNRAALANSRMTIIEAFRRCDLDVPEVYGTSAKLFCPWGYLHADGGVTRAMRVYPEDNSSYCFACSERLDPVAIYRKVHDLSYAGAAERILEDTGYREPSPEQRWEEAAAWRPEVDREALRAALEMYLTDVDPDFEQLALDGEVAHYYGRVLALLPAVTNDADAQQWLLVAKSGMQRVLESRVDTAADHGI